MATFKLVSVLVHTPPGSSDLSANDVVEIFWDDSTSALTVKKNGSSWSGSAGGYFGTLNTNYYVSGISSYEGEYAISGYSFCSGSDLKWFRMLTTFASYPYMQAMTTVNSPVCDVGGGVVCDIHWVGTPTIVHATDLTTGGSISVTAESSNGPVRYSLRNGTDYADMSNTTGVITGMPPGNWTLYAKDPNDCTAVKHFKILYKPISNEEHYRFTWVVGSRTHRIRIYEREYPGDLVELNYASTSPFKTFKPKQGGVNDKFFPVHPTNATITLISERDYQFLPLFTQDHRRYRVVEEVDEGSGFAEVWQGFIDPNVYLEDFVAAPYYVEIPVSDGIAMLQEEPFTDADGNLLEGQMSLIKVMAFVLKKTGLNLKIRSGINIFEVGHSTGVTDDPLAQTYIDVACYRRKSEPFSCWEVLEAILRPFGARVVQDNNQWLLEERDRAYTNYAYRVFSSDGEYESNGTANTVREVKAPFETDKVVLINQDHSLEVIPAYGTITVTTELNYVGSLIHGSFEKEDLLSPETEQMSENPGIFTSEEGFRDWTLRLNGTSGVSFGRSVVLTDDNSLAVRRLIDTERATRENIARSVGAFYFSPGSWSGNLRNAYIESAAKPYQYGPGDEIKLSFDYSTPSTTGDVDFMVLRFAVKVGSNWLQEDGFTWSTSEAIYRAYPKPSTSLQTFEMYIPLPEVTAITDTTIQLRIYYYAKDFYDFGLPSPTSSPSGGTEGLTDLVNFPTAGLDYDYRLDARVHTTTGSTTNYSRTYAELRISDAAEDIGAGILHPGDFNSTTNPRIWCATSVVLENNKVLDGEGSVRDTLFYIDNISVDSIINGQDPPREEVRSLTISKYVKGDLEVKLYNADRASVINAKNMYNNYFRLSDGTPTRIWSRSGMAEFLPLRDLLMKVLGGNHSAPTFRITGSFYSEDFRLTPGNLIKIIKPGSSLSLSNTTFTSDLSGWSQTGSGESFAWVSDNSGSAEVTVTNTDSKKLYQTITHSGGYINISVNLTISALSGNTLEHIMWAVFFKGSSIIHAEKLATYPSITSLSDITFAHTAFVPGDITGIGFFFEYVSGSGSITYQVTEFTPTGIDIEEIYQISDYQRF